MVYPAKPERPITCPFKKPGSSWSTGEHSGVDLGCPAGDPVYATWGGKVTGNSWGSAYGTHIVIDHDVLPSGDPGLWMIYAHLKNKQVSSGDRVEAGDLIGYSDNTGNSTGNHLHIEVQPQSTWVKGSYKNPQQWMDAGGNAASGAGGPHVTEHVYSNKMGYGEPSNGDSSSDSIKELQERLNRISLSGGAEITVTGVYDDPTDAEVRKWQEQICHSPPDAAGESYLGPSQFEAMFPDGTYTRHDEGLPAIASGAGTDDSTGTTLGGWLKEQGFTVEDDDVPFGRDSSWSGVDFVIVHHTVSPEDGKESDIANYIRKGGSGTYPPLAQIMLGQSGTVWMCSKQREGQAEPGRASQAGNGDGYGIPDDSMNAYSLGIECQCDGSHELATHDVLYDTLIRLCAALVQRYDLPIENIEEVIGHKEWSNTGKTDPRDDMSTLRSDVELALAGEPPPPTTLPPGDVYVSKLVKGTVDSDSVRRLQDVLNHTTISKSASSSTQGFTVVLEVNGDYDDLTDIAVNAWQEASGFPATDHVTVEQAELIFAGTGNTVIDDIAPPEPPPTEVVTLTGGHCHDIQAAMDSAASQKKTLRLTGSYAVYTNVYIPGGLTIDATGATIYVNSETAASGAKYNSGRFKNKSNNDAAGYGAAGWFTWIGGTLDGNGEGIMTFSHSPGYTIKGATFYRYCSSGNTGHAIETNSSGGANDLNGPYNVQILDNQFLGTDRGQRSNSNDEPCHWDWNWNGSGAAAPVWDIGDTVNETTQTMCHNILIKGNRFHRKSESGGWQFAKCAIGSHDASDSAYDPEYRHNHILIEDNEMHGAAGSSEVSPNKGAIHLAWARDVVVRNNVLKGGTAKRYVTAETSKDAGYCSASGNTSSSPTLSNPNTIVVEG